MYSININIGTTGSQIGQTFLKVLQQQHQKPLDTYRPSTFFSNTDEGTKAQVYPRSLLVDTKNHSYAPASSSPPYKPENILLADGPSMDLFVYGRYNCSEKFKEEFESRMYRQFQQGDQAKNFLLISSLSEGSGCGLTSQTLTFFRQHIPSSLVQTFRCLPSLDYYTHPIEIYNTVFGIFSQIQCTDMTFLFDQAATITNLMAQGNLRPSKKQIHQKLGQVIADSTIPFRYKGDLNTSPRKLATNLVLFPRMHFMTFMQSSSSKKLNDDPIQSLLRPSNCFLSNYLNSEYQIFNVYAGVRGRILSETDLVQQIKKQFTLRQYKFKTWIGDNFHISMHEPIKREETVLFMNSHSIASKFQQIGDRFRVSFRRKGFIHYYIQQGMDEMEFTQVQSNLNDLQSEYQPPSNHYYEDHAEQLDQEE